MPAAALGKVVWNLAACGLAAALTLWLAPRLWQLEEFHRKSQIVVARDQVGTGLPCCQDCLASSSRVAEYLDVGRGHDHGPVPGEECRICSPNEVAGAQGGAYFDGRTGDTYVPPVYTPVPPIGVTVRVGPDAVPDSYYWSSADGTVTSGTTTTGPIGPSHGNWGDDTIAGNATPAPAPNTRSTATAPIVADYPPAVAYNPPTPVAPVVPVPPPPPQAPMPRVAPPIVTPPALPAVPPTHPTAPAPTAAAAGAAPPSAAAAPPSPPSAPDASSSLPHILVYMLIGALSFRAFTLLLRPLRRALVVRHLRTPLWPETVDQRVSNAWQLALVGLRDAGYRCDGKESPREFAQRVGVDGLDRCATILERTRYGVAIDADDLADMQATAHAVYGTARQRAGGFARLASLLRWPLT
jgi:hypothetical protein